MANQEDLADRLAEVVADVGGQAELHRLSGVSVRTIGGLLRRETEARDYTIKRLAEGGGFCVEWLETGEGPRKLDVPSAQRAEEPAGMPYAMDRKRLAVVLAAVWDFQPSRAPAEQAGLVAMVYELMTARRSSDPTDVADILREVAKSAPTPPTPDFHSPEVEGDRDAQSELFRRRSTDRVRAGRRNPTPQPAVPAGVRQRRQRKVG